MGLWIIRQILSALALSWSLPSYIHRQLSALPVPPCSRPFNTREISRFQLFTGNDHSCPRLLLTVMHCASFLYRQLQDRCHLAPGPPISLVGNCVFEYRIQLQASVASISDRVIRLSWSPLPVITPPRHGPCCRWHWILSLQPPVKNTQYNTSPGKHPRKKSLLVHRFPLPSSQVRQRRALTLCRSRSRSRYRYAISPHLQ